MKPGFQKVVCALLLLPFTADAYERPRPFKSLDESALIAKVNEFDLAAIYEIGERKSPRAKEVLSEIADSEEIPERIVEIQNQKHRSSDPRLAKIRNGRFRHAKNSAKIALARMGEMKYLREFAEELKSDNLGIKEHGMAALGSIGDRRAAKHLIPLLDDDRKGKSYAPDLGAVPISSQASDALEKLLPDVLEQFRRKYPGRRYGFKDEWKLWWKTHANEFKDDLE